VLIALKVAIVGDARPQYEIARAAGLEETRLSKAIHGRCSLSPDEKHSIASTLGTSVAELFGSDAQ